MPEAVLIAGAGGMLGTALQQVCAARGTAAVAPAESGFDITDADGVDREVRSFAAAHPDGVVVNAAAFTNVDRAEEQPERAFAVNETGAANLAASARAAGLRFVHVSTDFVFDGTKAGAYTESDSPRPLSVYGASKLAGERAVQAAAPDALIVRTAWVFGPGGVNFPVKILARADEATSIPVVTDEVGSPTFTIDLAGGILGLIDAGASGIFHLTNSGTASRDELARAVLDAAGRSDVEVVPVSSGTFPVQASRPANSVLDCSKAAALGVVMPDWHDALERFVKGL